MRIHLPLVVLLIPLSGWLAYSWMASELNTIATKDQPMTVLHDKPYFTLALDMKASSFFIHVNGVEVLSSFSGSALATELPLNHWMRPGENTLMLTVTPPSEGLPLNPKAAYTLALKVRNKDQASELAETVATLTYSGKWAALGKPTGESSAAGTVNSAIHFYPDKKGDVRVSEIEAKPDPDIQNALRFTRTLDIPSSLPKWAFFDSDAIPDIDPMSDAESDAFLRRLLAEYLKVYRALQTNRVDEVLPLFDERNRELDAAFYYEPGTMRKKIRDALIDAATDKDAELVELSEEYVSFEYAENNKLARLIRESGKPALVQNFKNSIGSQSFDLVFRYKNGQWILTR